jgi:hypothetical protein
MEISEKEQTYRLATQKAIAMLKAADTYPSLVAISNATANFYKKPITVRELLRPPCRDLVMAARSQSVQYQRYAAARRTSAVSVGAAPARSEQSLRREAQALAENERFKAAERERRRDRSSTNPG